MKRYMIGSAVFWIFAAPVVCYFGKPLTALIFLATALVAIKVAKEL